MLPAITIAEVLEPKAPYILQGRPFSESLTLAAEKGFRGVELQCGDPVQLDNTLEAQCEKLGLQIISVATGQACKKGLSLSAESENIRRQSVRCIFDWIDWAEKYPSRPAIMIGLLVGRIADRSDGWEGYRKDLADSLKQIDRYGRKKQIAVNLEPLNHFDCDALNRWDDMVDFLEKEKCFWIRLGLDLYHMQWEETDIAGAIRKHADRIGSVQLMDNNRRAPGLGTRDFSEPLSAIRESGYDGPIIFECLPEPTPEIAMQQAMKFYRQNFFEH